MSNSIELRQQAHELTRSAQEWLDKVQSENRPEAEVEGEWSKRMTEIDAKLAEANAAERKEQIEARTARFSESNGRKTAPTQPGAKSARHASKHERNSAFKAWAGFGIQGVKCDGDIMSRAAEMGMPVHATNIEYRSLNTADNSDATFTSVSPTVERERKYYSDIVRQATIQTTDNGNTFSLPRGSDVSNVMSIIGQGSAANKVDPTTDKVSFGAYYFRTVIQLTYEMLQDAVFDVEGYTNDTLMERADRTIEKYAVAGTGSSQPKGLVAAAVAAGNTVTLAATKKNFYQFEDLFSLFSAVDPSYRQDATLVLHDSSVWDLRKIKDSSGRYIWDLNSALVQNAMPNKIAGYNYLVSNSVDAPGSFSKNIAVFAPLNKLVVRMVQGIQLTRLNELYRENGMVGVEAVMRFDVGYVGHDSSIAYVATPAS